MLNEVKHLTIEILRSAQNDSCHISCGKPLVTAARCRGQREVEEQRKDSGMLLVVL
jgi:hypothetical protein